MRSAACVLVTARFGAGRNDSAGDLVQTRARYRASCAEPARVECWSGWIGLPSATRRILIHINNTKSHSRRVLGGIAELAAAESKVGARRHGDPAVSAAAGPRGVRSAAAKLGPRLPHPSSLNVLMNSGAATPAQIRGWVANRFYYQVNIPIKDAAILSNCTDTRGAPLVGTAHSRPRRLRRGSGRD